MKSKIRYHTARYKGQEHTLHTKGWRMLIGKSQTFVYNRLKVADETNQENPMQFVVDEHMKMLEGAKPKYKRERAASRMPSIDSTRMKKEERFKESITYLVDNFLYPVSVKQQIRREHVRFD